MRLLHVYCTTCGLRAATARPARMVDVIAGHMAHGPVVVTARVVNRRRWRCQLSRSTPSHSVEIGGGKSQRSLGHGGV
jgi:hypothetical protein